MSDQIGYCITEIRSTEEGGASLFEVWGVRYPTGYRWLVAECNTRDEARGIVLGRRKDEEMQASMEDN